jgi:hypothetical protein
MQRSRDRWTSLKQAAAYKANVNYDHRPNGETSVQRDWRLTKAHLYNAAVNAAPEEMLLADFRNHWMAKIDRDVDEAQKNSELSGQNPKDFEGSYIENRFWEGPGATGPESGQVAFAPGLQGGHQQEMVPVQSAGGPGSHAMASAARVGFPGPGNRDLPPPVPGQGVPTDAYLQGTQTVSMLERLPNRQLPVPEANGSTSSVPSHLEAQGPGRGWGVGSLARSDSSRGRRK